jgi:hypothetical protein
MISPILLGRKAPGTAYTSSNDVFTAAIGPHMDALIRITLSVRDAVSLQIMVGGRALTAAAAETADRISVKTFAMAKGDTFNLRFSGNTTIDMLTVEELQSGAS